MGQKWNFPFGRRPGSPKNEEVREPSPEELAAAKRMKFQALAKSCDCDLLRVARRLCKGDDDCAQDLVQDSLVRAYEAYLDGRFEEGTNARAWLIRILTNGFLNDQRRRQRWESGVDLDALTAGGELLPESLYAAPIDIPGQKLLVDTLDEELERALNSLSEEHYLCVLLVDMEQMEYEEAAAALNIPIGTLRSRLSRARLKLYSLLQEYAVQRRII